MGYEVSEELGYADIYIINTCAVTAEAEKKSRQAIQRARKFNPEARIIVTGCASQKSPEDFLAKNGVTLVTGAKSKEKILGMLEEKGVQLTDKDEYGEEPLPIRAIRTRAFIKVQDGCDNFCSYCIIPYLRGRSRSRSICDILKEIEYLNPVEAVITGINLSAYNYEGKGLNQLIEGLSGVDCRIRLGSLEVNVITEELLIALKNLKNFAPHFHLSLQSGSNEVLKSMNRHYTREAFYEKCLLIRRYFPSAAITTDIIVGYSTESEENFFETCELARRVGFADLHCFPYSRREGTVGAKLKELPAAVKDERMKKLQQIKSELRKNFIAKNVMTEADFVPEEYEEGFTVGYTGNYVRAYVAGECEAKIQKIRITGEYLDGVKAEII